MNQMQENNRQGISISGNELKLKFMNGIYEYDNSFQAVTWVLVQEKMSWSGRVGPGGGGGGVIVRGMRTYDWIIR